MKRLRSVRFASGTSTQISPPGVIQVNKSVHSMHTSSQVDIDGDDGFTDYLAMKGVKRRHKLSKRDVRQWRKAYELHLS
jgi:hypothetical protein